MIKATLHESNFPGVQRQKLVEAIGVLPVWFTAWAENTPGLGDMHSEAQRTTWKMFIDHVYAHGGGWRNHAMNWKLEDDGTLLFPEDPPLKPVASIRLEEAGIQAHMYQHAFMCVRFSDGVFEVARLD